MTRTYAVTGSPFLLASHGPVRHRQLSRLQATQCEPICYPLPGLYSRAVQSVQLADDSYRAGSRLACPPGIAWAGATRQSHAIQGVVCWLGCASSAPGSYCAASQWPARQMLLASHGSTPASIGQGSALFGMFICLAHLAYIHDCHPYRADMTPMTMQMRSRWPC
jgi:hypothetical protein